MGAVHVQLRDHWPPFWALSGSILWVKVPFWLHCFAFVFFCFRCNALCDIWVVCMCLASLEKYYKSVYETDSFWTAGGSYSHCLMRFATLRAPSAFIFGSSGSFLCLTSHVLVTFRSFVCISELLGSIIWWPRALLRVQRAGGTTGSCFLAIYVPGRNPRKGTMVPVGWFLPAGTFTRFTVIPCVK